MPFEAERGATRDGDVAIVRPLAAELPGVIL